MQNTLLKHLKDVLLLAVRAGGDQMKAFFTKKYTIENKEGANNPVTEADLASEKAILQLINEHFPEHSILSEESGDIPHVSDYKWVIDPIDGTVNYAQGIPICGVSIAVMYKEEVILGAVYNPFLEELFFAEKNKGAFLNDQKITVSTNTDLMKACLATGFPYEYTPGENDALTIFERLVSKGIAVRRLGSAAIDLCWVACGRYDAYFEHQIKPWDSAAGSLIVREAGGKVSSIDGTAYSIFTPGVLASNSKIHAELLKVLAGHSVQEDI